LGSKDEEEVEASPLCLLLSACDPYLNRNAIKHRDNHKHRYAAEIILYFINVEY